MPKRHPQANLCSYRDRVFERIAGNQAVYNEHYQLYRTLHDAFGTAARSGSLGHVMKDLLDIRQRERR